MLKHILFDLDETLYPISSGLMNSISDRMRGYIQVKCNLSPQDAHILQKRYWNEYGTTLRGLMNEHEIDPQEYLAYVHDIDVAKHLSPDPKLHQVLSQIPYDKFIVTNGDVPHAERVLRQLGIADQFKRIFDIVFMEFECKPSRGAYRRVLRALDSDGHDCVLVEDTARNLPPAREFGIHTVLLLHPTLPTESGAFPDLVHTATNECPPAAEQCIHEIYSVAEAVKKLSEPARRPNPA